MTKTLILKAENFDDMEKIAKPFLEKGYKIISSNSKHIIARKRSFGSIFIHILLLFLILFVVSYNSLLLYVLCGVYILYFIFNLFNNSKVVLITTETTDEEGNPVEFDDIENSDFK
jgi:cytochrome c biogenesis protein ResB